MTDTYFNEWLVHLSVEKSLFENDFNTLTQDEVQN